MTGDHARQRRAVAYVRESTEEQGRGYSPDGRRQAIARYAEDHGFELADEYLDFETGRAADKRPGFQRLIEDAMAGRFEAVLVFHTSRFARNTIEAKRYKKLLRTELGGEVISVTQPPAPDVDDPAAFLAESVHDEYYSVSLSFWTKMGLREKARQGLIIGGLPWGYLKGEDGVAVPDPERAPVVHALFTIYATGRYSLRDLAGWLNERDHRTTRGNLFCADTVRDMLGNLTYCGYVTAQRSTSKEIRGRHEPLVDEELFDRVAELRRQRMTTRNPGRPSPRYLLRSIVRCERCGGRMHGTASGRKGEARYYCSTRRKKHGCDQPLAPAVPIEHQIAEWVADLRPPPRSATRSWSGWPAATRATRKPPGGASSSRRGARAARPLRAGRPPEARVRLQARRDRRRAGRARARRDARPRRRPRGAGRFRAVLGRGKRPGGPPRAPPAALRARLDRRPPNRGGPAHPRLRRPRRP